MTESQDTLDPRVEPFARFMQARDARTFEVQDTNGDFQTWDGIGEMGREEYLKDAAAYVRALDIIERPVPTTDAASRCPDCRHQPHEGRACLKMASDNDCVCEYGFQQPSPHPPTREQIAEAFDAMRADPTIPRQHDGSVLAVDAFEAGFRSALTLIQNGADR